MSALLFFLFAPPGGVLIFRTILSGLLFFTDLNDPYAAGVQSWGITYEGKEISLLELCGGKRVDLKFGQDADEQVYIMSKTEGKIYKIKR